MAKKKLNSQNSTCPNHSAAFSHLFLRVCVGAVYKHQSCPSVHEHHVRVLTVCTLETVSDLLSFTGALLCGLSGLRKSP